MLSIGPFTDIDNNPNYVIFNSRVKISYSHLVSLLKAKDGYYAVVDGYEEHDFAAPLPERYEVVSKLDHPRCPQCGNWDVIVDGDEMYCSRRRSNPRSAVLHWAN